MSKTPIFTVGQRWANTAEPELGIGIITNTDVRMITMYFPDSEATRTFAMASAPLIRVEFRPGETVENLEGERFTIHAMDEQSDLFFYDLLDAGGNRVTLPETQVVGNSAMAGPLERLLHGQTDRYKAFSLRYQTWKHHHQYMQSPLRGLMGPRVSLIPHQFHIAQQTSSQWQPRVMLADEVGLGKTIEAGLIVHKLLIEQHISRVLIVVPEPLVNQWLVEMLRRFNLPVRIFNTEQCEAICDSQDTDNPFETEQLVLCSLDFLSEHQQWRDAALNSEWDLLIVDEAHHLAWQPDLPETAVANSAYGLVEQFAQQAKGLLLLTATPEKEGHQSHFAQLRLLDPDRYQSLEHFVEQQNQFEQVAEIAEQLISGTPLQAADTATLKSLLNDPSSHALIDTLQSEESLTEDSESNHESSFDDPRFNRPTSAQAQQRQLATRLLDRQGTGRALYRNTRANIVHFPSRALHTVPLDLPDGYPADALYPEHDRDESWLDHDPRVSWLEQHLKANRSRKFLIICHHQTTAVALEQHLSLRCGFLCAAFHEQLSIIERDRAAAWFAEPETGAQSLICSEIGSEGRNFQFCHQLILFDLPTPVDLLEQRIGRLDRIGQEQDIQIHSLYFKDSIQERLFRWYHESLNAFEKTSSSASVVFSRMQAQFFEGKTDSDAFIAESTALNQSLNDAFIHGRNRLLELHSQGDAAVHDIIHGLDELDWDDSLSQYMQKLYSQYGVETEELSSLIELARPGTDMEAHVPGINEEGVSLTYDRETALQRDDIQFYTWDHPDVRAAMEMVISGEKGKASICLLKNKQLPEGTLLFELLYVIHCPAPGHLGIHQHLPPTPIRVLLDQKSRDLSSAVSLEVLDQQAKNVKGELVAAIIKNYRELIEHSVKTGSDIAENQFAALTQQARESFASHYNGEIERMTALAQTNPNIKPQAIEHLQETLTKGMQLLEDNAKVYLDGIRVMVTVQS